MARENQGLQIALIIFVILTILLGVFTFLFFRHYEEAAQKAKQFDEEAQRQTKTARDIEAVNIELRKIIGFDPSEKLDSMQQQFAKDMEIYGPDVEEANRSYRKVLAHQLTVIQAKNASLQLVQEQLQQAKNKIEALEAEKSPLIAQQEKRATDAEADRDSERQKFNQDRQTLTQTQAQLQSRWETAQRESQAAMEKLQADLAAVTSRLQDAERRYKDTREQLDSVKKPTFELAHGKIRWVNQRAGTVWINLGRADALAPQTTFAVYSGETRDVTKAVKKASIEVTQILGDHLAEARITEDNIADPILPGDVIHTPIWSPGEQQRFALTDGMDLDKDGREDLETVKALVTSGGGIVAAWIDTKTGDLHGAITASIDYLVLGEEPTSSTPKAVVETRGNVLRRAQQLGIRVISLQELLNRMGYRNQTPVVRYGPGANPADFRAQPPEGRQPTSTGNVSDIFRKREPPRSTSGGAY